MMSVMISELLFGYFLFKEKVTDAPSLKQVASDRRNRTTVLCAENDMMAYLTTRLQYR